LSFLQTGNYVNAKLCCTISILVAKSEDKTCDNFNPERSALQFREMVCCIDVVVYIGKKPTEFHIWKLLLWKYWKSIIRLTNLLLSQ